MQLLQMCLYTDARVCSRFNVRRSVLINYINFAVDLNFDLLPLLVQQVKGPLAFLLVPNHARLLGLVGDSELFLFGLDALGNLLEPASSASAVLIPSVVGTAGHHGDIICFSRVLRLVF